MPHFEPFRSLMSGPLAPQEVGEIGAALARDVQKACDALGLGEAEIHCGGGWVTLLLTPRDAWEVEFDETLRRLQRLRQVRTTISCPTADFGIAVVRSAATRGSAWRR